MGFINWSAFFQATALGLLGFYLTLQMKPNVLDFSYFDCLFPIAVSLYVYFHDGLLGFNGAPNRSKLGGGEGTDEQPIVAPKMGPTNPLIYVSGKHVHVGGGNIVVVLTWSTTCEESKKSFTPLCSTYKRFQKDASFLGISQDTPQEIDHFLQARASQIPMKTSNRVPFACASDPSGEVTTSLDKPHGVSSVPHVYIIGGTGVVEWHGHPSQLEPALNRAVRYLGAVKDEDEE